MNYNPYQRPMLNNYMGIQGKIVNDFGEITVNDVPMNGQCAFFPKSDMSEIQIRRWNANGLIENAIYRPYEPNLGQINDIPMNDSPKDINSLYESINERLERIEKALNPTKKRGAKNEPVADDAESDSKQ